MKRIEMIQLVDTKVSEMMDSLDELLLSSVSESTRRAQKSQRLTSIHNMCVLKTILEQSSNEEFSLNGDLDKWFKSMVTLTSEKKAKIGTVEVHEGDNIMQLAFDKYKDVKDVVAKINRAVDKAGLKIVNGIVTR